MDFYQRVKLYLQDLGVLHNFYLIVSVGHNGALRREEN